MALVAHNWIIAKVALWLQIDRREALTRMSKDLRMCAGNTFCVRFNSICKQSIFTIFSHLCRQDWPACGIPLLRKVRDIQCCTLGWSDFNTLLVRSQSGVFAVEVMPSPAGVPCIKLAFLLLLGSLPLPASLLLLAFLLLLGHHKLVSDAWLATTNIPRTSNL